MNRFIGAFMVMVGMVMATNALAGSYSSSAALQESCNDAGTTAKNWHGRTKKEVERKFADINKRLKSGEFSESRWRDLSALVGLGKDAPSDHAAYMRGWAYCMDAEKARQ